MFAIGIAFLVGMNNHRENFCLERGFDGHKGPMCFEVIDDRNIEFFPIATLRLIERHTE